MATIDASTDLDTKATSTVPPKPMRTRRKAAAEVRVLRNHNQTSPAKTASSKTRPVKKVKDKENVASVANQQPQDEIQSARKRGRAAKVPVLDQEDMVKTRGEKTTQEVQPPAPKKHKGLKKTVAPHVATEKESAKSLEKNSDVMQKAMNVSLVVEKLQLSEINERRGRTRSNGNSDAAAVKVVEKEGDPDHVQQIIDKAPSQVVPGEKRTPKKKEKDVMNASVVIEPLPVPDRRVRTRAKVNPDPSDEPVIIEKPPTRASRRKATLNTGAVTLELQDKKKETKRGKSVQSLNKREYK